MDAIPHLQTAVEILFDWIEFGKEVRKQNTNTKAATFINDEKYAPIVDAIEKKHKEKAV